MVNKYEEKDVQHHHHQRNEIKSQGDYHTTPVRMTVIKLIRETLARKEKCCALLVGI